MIFMLRRHYWALVIALRIHRGDYRILRGAPTDMVEFFATIKGPNKDQEPYSRIQALAILERDIRARADFHPSH